MSATQVLSENDPKRGFSASLGAAVTPSDTVDLDFIAEYLYVGSIAGGATVTVITAGGSTITFAGLAAGTFIPVRVSRVKATGTLATSIVALW